MTDEAIEHLKMVDQLRTVSDPDHTFLKLDIARTLLSSTAHVDLDEAERIFKWITSK